MDTGWWATRGLALFRLRRVRIAVGTLAVVAIVSSIAIADAGKPPTNGYVATTSATILSGVNIAANASISAVALGGSTGVPSDATAVRLTVTVGGSQTGKLQIYPAADSTAAGFTTVSWAAGGTTTATIRETVGAGNKITFANISAGSATVTVTITGYSTQITATNIAPDGGSTGQVLTNTGSGAKWQPAGKAYEQTTGFSITRLSTSLTTVAAVTVPAGSYLVTFTSTTSDTTSTTPNDFRCDLVTPSAATDAEFFGSNDTNVPQSTVAGQALISVAKAGTISVQCLDSNGLIQMTYPVLIATAEGTVSGFVGAAPPARDATASVRPR